VAYPVVWTINTIANALLRLIGVSANEQDAHQLSSDELRTVVNEAAAMIPRRHKQMLVNILDLEKVTVDDIMVPRSEIVGIDLDDKIEHIVEQLCVGQHTRLPVFRGIIDETIGFIHVRSLLRLVGRDDLTKEAIEEVAREPYFVPQGTPLNTQLLNFQRGKRRIGLVVNEYGDILGLVTLEDILEEIVGEFTTDVSAALNDVQAEVDGSFIIGGGVNIRALNRMMRWKLPTRGPKTLNGLILEHLESIPRPGTSLLIADHPVEILQTTGNAVKVVRVRPALERTQPPPE
jgi:Mg2+/Co2+ transporter CorB